MQRDLTALFDPSSVAIVGASDDPAKWGNWLARGALQGEHRRPVYLINHKGTEVLGHDTYRSITDLPEAPELVVVAVPAGAFEQTVDDALAIGARAFVGITAGLGESGADAQQRERQLVERVRAAGAILLGPNCLGVFDNSAELGICSNEFPAGQIGLISQSGNLALEMGIKARDYDLGFARFASLGNQADVDLAELVTSMGQHAETELVAVYIEDFRDGRAFVDAAATCGKPVIVLTVGASAASARAAMSHTGALVSGSAVVEAACSAAGAHLVHSPTELIDLAQALLQPLRRRGARIAVVGDGGGHGAIACDQVDAAGLELPVLSAGLSASIAAGLPSTAATGNPVDLAGGGEQDFMSYANVTKALLDSGEVDAVLMTGYFGGYSQYSQEFLEREVDVAHAITAAVRASGRPMISQTMYSDEPTSDAMREGGVPTFRTIEAATAALVAIDDRPPSAGAPAIPPAEMTQPLQTDYFGARDLLERAGVGFVDAVEVRGRDEAQVAAGQLGFPVVVKALGMLHKSDAGGVAVGIADAAELERVVADMEERLAPPSLSLERMAPLSDGVELIIGARRDSRFGPIAMVGLGGLYAEVLEDVAIGLAPLDQAGAVALLKSLRGAAILHGARGRPPVDIAAAAAAAVALSRLAAARPDIAEIEVNPLLVTPTGALGLDARIIPVEGSQHAG
jgi:acyl-CoA synthetase (NDP forming)